MPTKSQTKNIQRKKESSLGSCYIFIVLKDDRLLLLMSVPKNVFIF